MRPLEIAALTAAILCIGAVLFRDRLGIGAAAPLALAGLAAALMAAHALGAPFRWQMIPACAVVLGAVALLALDLRPDGVTRFALSAAAALACGASALLTAGMPVRALPPPDGPFAVGVTSTELTRTAEDGDVRRLTVRLWYPAEPGPQPRAPLWPEFRAADAPAPARLLTRYMDAMRTHSAIGAPVRAGERPYPLILYNHSLVSIPSETALLMESLASQGYVVAAIAHTDQMGEYRRLNAATPAAAQARDRALTAQLRDPALSRAARAEISAALYRNSTATPEIVRRRAADSVFVLDRIDTVLPAIAGCGASCADTGRVGALGFSLGGAVATRLCRIDARCAAVVNMDGGLFADPLTAPPPVPYLMLYSAANEGANDALPRGAAYEEAVAPGAKHMDFHDATLALPLMRLMGALGRASGADMVRWRNARVRDFFDARLGPGA